MRLFITRDKERVMQSQFQPLNQHELDLILRIYEEKVKDLLETGNNGY